MGTGDRRRKETRRAFRPALRMQLRRYRRKALQPGLFVPHISGSPYGLCGARNLLSNQPHLTLANRLGVRCLTCPSGLSPLTGPGYVPCF